MKTKIAILFAAIAVSFTGCSTADKLLLTSQDTVIPASTNAVTGAVTQAATNTVYEPAPAAQMAVAGVAAIPLPFTGVAAIAGGWLLTAYAAWRNKKLSSALVTGIEAGRKILQSTPEGQAIDAKFKDELIQHQEIAGVLNQASALVNSLTGNTVQ